MPCYDLHFWFGETLSSRLHGTRTALPEGETARAAFCAGLNGPDPLFFDLVPPPLFRHAVKPMGNALHSEASDEVFGCLFRALRNRSRTDTQNADALTGFGLGFLCHYVLDAALHPLICAVSGNGMDHTRFETALDSVLLSALGERTPLGSGTKLSPSRPLTARQVPGARSPLESIDAAVSETVEALFGEPIPGAYKRSFFKDRLLHAFLYDPSGHGHAFFRWTEHTLRLKEGLVSGFLFIPCPPEEKDDRFFTLARRESDKAMSLLMSAFDRAEALFVHAVPALTSPDDASAEQALHRLTNLMMGSTMSYGMEG